MVSNEQISNQVRLKKNEKHENWNIDSVFFGRNKLVLGDVVKDQAPMIQSYREYDEHSSILMKS